MHFRDFRVVHPSPPKKKKEKKRKRSEKKGSVFATFEGFVL